MDNSTESYIMLLLADGNLPTGSFVASSGFESYVKHGFFGTSNSSTVTAPNSNQAIANFIQDNLGTYSRSALPFVSDAYIAVAGYRSALEDYSNAKGVDEAERVAMDRLISLDNLYHSMTLNDVTRRASKSQGVALLTLFSKGFSKPSLVTTTVTETQHGHSHESMLLLVDKLKTIIRREDTHGHLPICWGVLTAALGLSLERSQYLHLFLQARSLLSAAIRLNVLGPYAAQQLLLHVIKGMVEAQMGICRDLRTGLQHCADGQDGEVEDDMKCAASTWPLGEILAARHDLQHSRIFNS